MDCSKAGGGVFKAWQSSLFDCLFVVVVAVVVVVVAVVVVVVV